MEHSDRQSYEVQIRELFERDCASRAEIDRLNKAMRTIIVPAALLRLPANNIENKYRQRRKSQPAQKPTTCS